MDRLLHAADGGDRDHPLRAERLQPPDVGAEVQLRRWQAMAAAVARQEDDGAALERPRAVLVRRIAERGSHPAPADVREALELVEPAAPDDPDRRLAHRTSRLPRVASGSAAVTRTRARRRRRRSGPRNVTSI